MTVYAESDGCGTISLFAKNVPKSVLGHSTLPAVGDPLFLSVNAVGV